jgi:hydrogenase maturation factor
VKRLPLGKIPIEVLNDTVLKLTGAASDQLVAQPRAGLDFAAVKVGDKFMVASADPITGVSENIGAYAVHVSANDVATSGNKPQFAEVVILLPRGSFDSDLKKVARQVHEAALKTGITILGGHTEVAPGIDHPILMATVFSIVDKFVTSGDAQDGDTMMMTKTAGLEGTAELASEYRFRAGDLRPSTLRRARRFIEKVDITKEAVASFGTGKVHAMHDCTEGGVVGAAFEMSLASGLGFVLEEAAVPVARETREICDVLSIDPLRLIGSGSLLLSVAPGAEAEVEDALRGVCDVTSVGSFASARRFVLGRDGSSRELKDAPQDELWRVLVRRRGSR